MDGWMDGRMEVDFLYLWQGRFQGGGAKGAAAIPPEIICPAKFFCPYIFSKRKTNQGAKRRKKEKSEKISHFRTIDISVIWFTAILKAD